MLVNFKTISQVNFTMHLEKEQTILDVKEKIAKEKGADLFPPDSMKLIYNGKVLEDTQTLEELNFTLDKFIVVMVSKKKATVDTAVSSGVPATQTATTAAPVTSSSAPLTTSTETTPSVLPITPQSENLTAEQETTVEAIIAMGYPRDQVVQAVRLAYGDADRAVEYLCTGFPDSSETDNDRPIETSVTTARDGLGFLNQDPQFDQLRAMVQSNPDLLPEIIEHIGNTNPQLLESIQNNQEQFVNILNATTGAPRRESAASADSGNSRPNMVTIPVTAAEQNAIERLKAMGFSEHLVIEAYFSCDKNEDLAVNYILNRMDEAEAEQESALQENQRRSSD